MEILPKALFISFKFSWHFSVDHPKLESDVLLDCDVVPELNGVNIQIE